MRYAIRRKGGTLEYARVPKNISTTKVKKSWDVIQAPNQKVAFSKFAKKEIRQELKHNRKTGLY